MDNKKTILTLVFLGIFVVVSFVIFSGWRASVTTFGVGGSGIPGAPGGAGISDGARDSVSENYYKVAPSFPQNPNYGTGTLTQRKIVKNGSLTLLVSKVEETAGKIQSIAAKFGGFVSDSQIYEVSKDKKTGYVTIRIPADKYESAMAELKSTAIKVERENTASQDVTEQFADLEATIKNLKAEEAQYQGIMKMADTVEDILRVSERLASVRGRIESAEGSLKYLSRQVDMSSITINLNAEEDAEVFGIRWRPLVQAKQALRDMIIGVTDFIDILLSFIIFIPLILLWTVSGFLLVIIVRKIFNWAKAKYFP